MDACVFIYIRICRYSSLTYFLSKVFVELPFQIFFPVLMILILYFPLNLQGRFQVIALFMVLLNNVGQALGMAIGASFENKEMAMQVRPCLETTRVAVCV